MTTSKEPLSRGCCGGQTLGERCCVVGAFGTKRCWWWCRWVHSVGDVMVDCHYPVRLEETLMAWKNGVWQILTVVTTASIWNDGYPVICQITLRVVTDMKRTAKTTIWTAEHTAITMSQAHMLQVVIIYVRSDMKRPEESSCQAIFSQ